MLMIAVYSFDDNMSKSFVGNTTVILHQLAEVSQALDSTVSTLSYMTKSDLPHMFRQLMLSYHHVSRDHLELRQILSY